MLAHRVRDDTDGFKGRGLGEDQGDGHSGSKHGETHHGRLAPHAADGLGDSGLLRTLLFIVHWFERLDGVQLLAAHGNLRTFNRPDWHGLESEQGRASGRRDPDTKAGTDDRATGDAASYAPASVRMPGRTTAELKTSRASAWASRAARA